MGVRFNLLRKPGDGASVYISGNEKRYFCDPVGDVQ